MLDCLFAAGASSQFIIILILILIIIIIMQVLAMCAPQWEQLLLVLPRPGFPGVPSNATTVPVLRRLDGHEVILILILILTIIIIIIIII